MSAGAGETRLEALLEAAEAHGRESDPDHEVGDLQDLVRACWARLPEADRAALHEDFSDALRLWAAES